MTNTRVKVKRTDLITKLKVIRQDHEQTHQKALSKYASDLAKTQLKLKTSLQKVISEVDSDFESAWKKVHCGYQGNITMDLGKLDLPSEPVLRTQELDKMIRVLEASCDETISVAVGDTYAKYL